MLTKEQIEALRDGATPGPLERLIGDFGWSAEFDEGDCAWIQIGPSGGPVIALTVARGHGGKRLDANAALFQAAPDLRDTALDALARLADAQAAQALVVERAIKEGMRIPASVPVDQVQHAIDDAIRALADPSGVEALAALRAELDQRHELHLEQVRITSEWIARHYDALAQLAEAQAQVARLVGALEFYADKYRDGYDVAVTNYGLSAEEGPIIRDGGEIARAALAALATQGTGKEGAE